MEAQPLVCFSLAWLCYKQGRASTAPPQGQLPSRGLAPLSPALTHCCPSQRKRPHPVGWILSWRGKLRKKERRGEREKEATRRWAEVAVCSNGQERSANTKSGHIVVLKGGLPAQFKSSFVFYPSSLPTLITDREYSLSYIGAPAPCIFKCFPNMEVLGPLFGDHSSLRCHLITKLT